MNLWRVHLKPGGADRRTNVPKFCIDQRIVGVGWPVASRPSSKAEYWKLFDQKYPKRKSSVKAVVEGMAVGDLAWVRCGMTYYLGKINGEWEYRSGKGYGPADVHNVRPWDWVEVGEMDKVPGAVVTAFIRGQAVRRVRGASSLLYSRYLYAKLKGEPLAPELVEARADILELLLPEDLEDVAALYLQLARRCLLFPSTCKKDTKWVECLFSSAEDGGLVGLQVKRGNDRINRDKYSDFHGTVYLFQTRGLYDGKSNPKCVVLEPHEMRKFVLDQRALMPGRVQAWINFAEGR